MDPLRTHKKHLWMKQPSLPSIGKSILCSLLCETLSNALLVLLNLQTGECPKDAKELDLKRLAPTLSVMCWPPEGTSLG